MKHEDEKSGIRAFLTQEEEQRHRDLFEHLARDVVMVADADLRFATTRDTTHIADVLRTIQAAYAPLKEHRIPSSVVAATDERERVFETAVTEGFQKVTEIIDGGGGHSLLAKVIAVLAYVDIAQEHGWPDGWESFFQQVFTSTPERGGGVILGGAFYARLASYHLQDGSGTSDFFDELDTLLNRSVTSKKQAINKLGIHATASVLARMIEAQELGMRIPWVRVTQGDNEESLWEEFGEGYPHHVIYLGIGFLVSEKKMGKAVTDGMPDTRGMLNQRQPRILVGITVTDPDSPANDSRFINARRFYHISLRPLRKPSVAAQNAFPDERSFKREDVLRYASFDALPYMIATRMSRKLSPKFDEIEKTEYPRVSSKIARQRKEDRKRRILAQTRDHWIEFLTEPLETHFGNTRSILDVAHIESQLIDGTIHWGAAETVNHLRYTLPALACRNANGILIARTENEIADMYLAHIWKEELTLADKYELARALLADTDSLLWRKIPEPYATVVAQSVERRTTVPAELMLDVINWIDLRDRLIFRCETIRYKYEPEGMK